MANSDNRYAVFDLDGVLCDFSHSFSRLAATMFRIELHETHTQPNFRWLSDQGVSKAEQSLVWDKVQASSDFWLKMPSLLSEYDVRAMHMLAEEGVKLIYLTNRHDKGTMLDQTQQWIWRHGLPNGIIRAVEEKDLHLRERMLESTRWRDFPRLDDELREDPGHLLGVIEDSPYNLVKYEKGIAKWYTRPIVYVADRLYNRDVAPSLPRVSSVMDFCDRLLDRVEDARE